LNLDPDPRDFDLSLILDDLTPGQAKEVIRVGH
jgi:hypothetical protein